MNLRESILASALPEATKLNVWGNDVYVGVMTGTQRDRFETANSLDKGNVRARLAVFTLRDSEGKSLFTESDIPALGNLSSVELDRIFDLAIKVNKIGKQDVAELEKNSV